MKRRRGLFDMYADDSEAADRQVFGRVSYPDRRGFLKGAGLTAMATALGGCIPFHHFMPAGLIQAAIADGILDFSIDGKDGLVVLNERPVNAEIPAHLLDADITPINRHFVRNNGVPPEGANICEWTLSFSGEVENPMTLTISRTEETIDVIELALQI